MLDELDVVFGDVAQIIQKRCAHVIKTMQYNTFTKDEEGKINDKFLSSRIKMKASASEDEGRPILEAVKDIIQELWSDDLDTQMNQTWKKVIKSLLRHLPVEWTVAMAQNDWKSLIIDLFAAAGLSTPSEYKYRTKCLLLDGIARSLYCIHFWKTLIGEYHPSVAPTLADSKCWTPQMYEQLHLFLFKNWNKLFEEFWRPRSLLNLAAVTDFKLLGFRFLKIGYFLYHAGSLNGRFKNVKSLISSAINVKYYHFGSQIEGIHLPQWARTISHEVKRIIWNVHDDPEHITMKNSFYAIPLFRSWCNQHMDKIEIVYGTGKFTNGNGIGSDVVSTGTLAQRVTAVFTNFESNWEPLNKKQVTAMHGTIDTLAEQPMIPKVKYVFGICRKVFEMAEEGVRNCVFFSFFVVFWYLCKILHKCHANVFVDLLV